jgi:GTPase
LVEYKTNFIKIKKHEQEIDVDIESFLEGLAKEQQSDGNFEKAKAIRPEDDDGCTEYKLKLVNPPEERVQHLITQMQFRINEGSGEAFYKIGYEDNGFPLGMKPDELLSSIKTILRMASELKADVIVLQVLKGEKGLVVILLVRKFQWHAVKMDIRIMLLGETGAGKSTLLGVLTSGVRDNGNGSARLGMCSRKHEFIAGHTSTLNIHVPFLSPVPSHLMDFFVSQSVWIVLAT